MEPVNSDLIYCFYLLKFYKSKFLKTSQGTTFEAINRKDIANGTFPFTNNIHEQQKIASILSKVDELIQKTDQVIKQTQRLKKGLMQSLLTKGIGHTRFKTTSIGMIPESWVVTKLRQVVHSYKNGIYKSSHYHGHGTPNIRMFNINDGKVDTVGAPLLEVTKKEELDYNLHIGDILINRVNSADLVAKAGIVDHDLGSVVFDSMIIRLRTLNEKCNPYFLSYFLISKKYYDQIHPVVKHAIGQSSINQDDINNLEFALPPIREQQKIITIISNIDNCIQKRQSYKLLIDNLKIGIMQKLLTGKIRVKV
ncbi:restriction endonuclease subunit S [Nitrososphaera sp. AFS]|nr:restriction endonuclease subunit S [Nitrososphaera sp. AFS]